MEDVLDVYARPYDPRRPQDCFDEKTVQLIVGKRCPLPLKPGRPERLAREYQRNGTRNLLVFFQPLAGWRHVEVTKRRAKIGFAHCMRYLVAELFPEADAVVVVLDNLNTRTPAVLYEAFEPAEARRIMNRPELHYTPKHGSWLNMVEIEIGVLTTVSQPRIRCDVKRLLGKRHTMSSKRLSIGVSACRTLVSISSASTRIYQDLLDGVLEGRRTTA